MDQWIEEFLYRGRPPAGPGSELAPEFHVTVGQQVESAFEQGQYQRRTLGPLTPAKATEMGLTLELLVAGINAAALDELAGLTDQLAQKRHELADAVAEAAQLRAQLATLPDQLAEARHALAAAQAEIARLIADEPGQEAPVAAEEPQTETPEEGA